MEEVPPEKDGRFVLRDYVDVCSCLTGWGLDKLVEWLQWYNEKLKLAEFWGEN